MSMRIDIKAAWEELRKRVEVCRKCELCHKRTHTVFGEGLTEKCRCVIIGEAPGKEEDEQGRPFVGDSGQLLTKILRECGIPRETVYIMNMVKCRPPNNRDPEVLEMEACSEYLEAQLLLLHPDIVLTVGKIATQKLLNTKKSISSMRGKLNDWRSIRILPIFHPSYLLRSQNTNHMELTYRDIKALKAVLDSLKS